MYYYYYFDGYELHTTIKATSIGIVHSTTGQTLITNAIHQTEPQHFPVTKFEHQGKYE